MERYVDHGAGVSLFVRSGLMAWWRTSKRAAGASRTQSKVHTESACIIIGAGHVGLSVARGLRALGIEPIMIEQHSRIGDSWRYRYERLHLHHVTDAMHLPGVKYPEHVPRYLSRLDLADYLEGYAGLAELNSGRICCTKAPEIR